MTYDTINDAVTRAGGGGALLAGRYRVVRQLGQGGMGSVWLAEDTQLDNKQFAIKMLPSILVSNKRAYRQLKDEALVAMKLTHPNIVTLRAFEENNGNPFLVMDYVDGQTLDDLLAEKGELDEGEAMVLLRPIAAALDYAHGKGVVHRDVKPGNVMIAKDGTPYILDFGIAREIQETMTRVTGKLSSGTLLYMSPEQLNGDAPKPAQDIYSFAAMAYECLKGEPPFSRGNIEFQIMNKEPEPLVGRDVPIAPLADSVMAGLAKKPEDRPATCAAVLEGDVSRGDAKAQGQAIGCLRVESEKNDDSARVISLAECKAAALKMRLEEEQRVAALAAERVDAVVPREPSPQQIEDGFSRTRLRQGNGGQEERKGIGMGKVLGILALLAALGGGAWYHQQQQEIAAERREKAAATESRIEAKEQQARVGRISDADGFKERKDALAEVFTRAEARYDERAGLWKDATVLFKRYIEQSQALLLLDGERQTAAEKRKATQDAFRAAEAAGAKTHATASWNAAVDVWRKASGEFSRMEFAKAGASFEEAEGMFAGSGQMARDRKRETEVKSSGAGDDLDALLNDLEKANAQRPTEGRAQQRSRLAAPRHGDARKRVQLWEGGPYWATVNIGAEEPWESGYYFWWGDTVGYKPVNGAWEASDGSLTNFSFEENNTPTYDKDVSVLKREGWITADNVLAPEHDAAQAQWGGGWRMPTKQEQDYLRDMCDWKMATMNGVNGYIIRGKGNYASATIFLPCAGNGDGSLLDSAGSCGWYWSSVPYSVNGNGYSGSLFFNLRCCTAVVDSRYYGRTIRPVQGFAE